MKTLHPHSGLIDALGGTAKTAKAAETTGRARLRSQTVSTWRQRGIAYEWRPTIAELARRAGVSLPPDFLLPAASRPAPDSGSGEAHA